MSIEGKCPSRFKNPFNHPVSCEVDGRHSIHRGDGYIWRTDQEMPSVTFPEDKKKVAVSTAPVASEQQVGGDHYKGGDMQPIDVIDAFSLDFYEGSALKYLLRHRKKNGKEDILKAIHYLQLLLERQYK
jgi:hypothetical protein